jgi:hypothetical protein
MKLLTGLRQTLNRTDSTLLIILTSGIILIDFNERNSTFFLAWVLMLLLYIFFAAVLIYSFIISYRTRSSSRIYIRFLPFIIGFFILPVLFLLSGYFKNEGFKSIVLEARHGEGRKGINLTLFKDKTFRLLNSGLFGGDYIRGNYRYTADTLYIDTNKLTNLYPTGKFVIRTDEKKQAYIDPVMDDSSVHFSLLIKKDKLTRK